MPKTEKIHHYITLNNGREIEYKIDDTVYSITQTATNDRYKHDNIVFDNILRWLKITLEKKPELAGEASNLLNDALKRNFIKGCMPKYSKQGVNLPILNPAIEQENKKIALEQENWKLRKDLKVGVEPKTINYSASESIETHPVLDFFPSISKPEFTELCIDIKKNGLKVPIKVLDGQLIDGRARLKACLKVNVPPVFEYINGDNASELAISLNCHKRHLTTSQKAWIAALLASTDAYTQKQTSKILSVSLRQVLYAREAQKILPREFFSMIANGEITVNLALKFKDLDEDTQKQVLEMDKKFWAKVIRKLSNKAEKKLSTPAYKMFDENEQETLLKAAKINKMSAISDTWIKKIVLDYCNHLIAERLQKKG